MQNTEPFRPAGACWLLSAPTSAPPAGVNAQGSAAAISGASGDVVLEVFNPGPSLVWLSYGASPAGAQTSAVAPTGGTPQNVLPIPSGTLQTFTLTWNTFLSALAVGAAQNIYITPGQGL